MSVESIQLLVGGTFPSKVYQESVFAFQFVIPDDVMTYYSLGSTTGKCNIMGYWHTGNTAAQQPDAKIRTVDAAICTDTCTVASTSCGWVSDKVNNRTKYFRSTPLVDFGASDAVMKPIDYTYYKDLLMLPAVGGGVRHPQ